MSDEVRTLYNTQYDTAIRNSIRSLSVPLILVRFILKSFQHGKGVINTRKNMQYPPAEWIQNYLKCYSYPLLMKKPSVLQTLDTHCTFTVSRHNRFWSTKRQHKSQWHKENLSKHILKHLDTTEIHRSTLIKLCTKLTSGSPYNRPLRPRG